MAVKVQTSRQSNRFHDMKLLSSEGAKSRSGDVYINVTALVDMMTVLVIFLVMNFNASGEMLFVSKDMTMPTAEHGYELTRVPIVSLTSVGDVYFEGIILIPDLGSRAGDVDWRIPELEEKLVDNRRRFEAIGGERAADMAPEEDPTTTVNVQIDAGVDFRLIKRVLHTCELAGYGRIRLTIGDARKSDLAEHGEEH
jgi:biopolymer transport protein ExbD